MSLGPGWWFSKPSTPRGTPTRLTPRGTPTPRTPRATPTFQTQRGTSTFQIPRGTLSTQTLRGNIVTQNNTGSKYAVSQQREFDHLPGLVEKPAQLRIPLPQQSVVSPRKRKTWQTSQAESSYPRLDRQDGVSKLHRYSDSKINYLGNQETRTLTPSDLSQRLPQPVSLLSNQNVSLSYSRRKQWDHNKNVKLKLASEYDQRDLTASEASHVDKFIVASVHFSGHPPPQPKYSNPQPFSGHSQPQPKYFQPQSFIEHPPPNPKYSQPHSFFPQVFANKNLKNYPHDVRYPGNSDNRHDNHEDSNYTNPVYPQHLHMDQFSHGQEKVEFLPHIQTNYNRSSDVILNVSPRRRNWSSPITYYDNPTVFWVNMGSESDENKLPGRHKGSRTPRKSKRMAAKLDGHSSTETDSRQFSDSADGRRSPLVQKEEMVSSQSALPSEPEPTTQYSAPPQSIRDPPSDHVDPPSQHSTLSQSEDDIPMIQKLQQLNHKQQPDPNKKKGPPSWLKNEDLAGPFEGPPSSRQEQRTPVSQAPVKNDDHMYQTKQDDIDMLIDEELAMWPKTGKSELKTVFDAEKAKPEPSKDDGKATPMQKIKENRSKWRENQKKNLEESWGSLTMFDRQQKGRISMDLDDDSLDEYLNPPKKQVPKEAPIQEEEDDDLVDAILNEVPGDEDFIIPELPYGKSLVIDIISTWGDRHYVGLTGIQLFTSTGDAVTISKISAEPSDINILDEYNKDPRVISNVLDGVNRTRDDVHMWLAPFTEGKHNYINLTFDKPCNIALMRIWNYNKSRIHSYRGAKDVIIKLDKNEIFKGEIERACGGIEGGTEAFGDTILFTTDENILECVSRNDDAYEGEMFDSDEPDDVPFERPRTADAGDENRPFTRAVGNIDGSTSPLPPRPATSMVTEGDVIVFKGKQLLLCFTATWGDMHYLGLTGLEVVGRDGEALPVTINMMNGSPRDLHSLPGHENDDRTLDKVIDSNNLTTSDEHMWMIPFTEGQNHTLSIEFSQTQMISGLRVWNYNKSREDTYRGARIVHVTIDDKQVSPPEGYLIRKGPGVCHFDFAQEISFAPQTKPPQPTVSKSESKHLRKSTMSTDEASQEYENVQMPSGFIYQLQMITTWGDPYYVGLNGLEFYDAQHNRIELTENNISAYPDSVNVLDGTSNDVRTPDKLIDGFNDTLDGTHMWVAPILPGIVNRVYVIFDQPTTVSMIKLWNYSKTPSRGAKDFALLVDDLLVYNGNLQAVTQGARGIIPGVSAPQKYHTILFTDNKEILRKEKHTVISNQTGDQDIQLTNDKQVVSHYNDPKKADSGKPVNQQLRPKTSLVATKKRR